jgi:hypothetical protein
MGSIEDRISRLEARRKAIAAETAEDEKLERQRAIMAMILDEVTRLKASGGAGDLLERAVRNVVAEQYADLGEESCIYIADGWIETLREWTRLDWMVTAERARPPDL